MGKQWIFLFTVVLSLYQVTDTFNTRYSHGASCSLSPTLTIPQSNDCSTFLRCISGKWKDYKCPVGSVFNADRGMCTWPWLYPECVVPTTESTKLIEVNSLECIFPCAEDGRTYLYPNLTTCDDFYMCRNRKLYKGACSDIPGGLYRHFNFFMFSCDRDLESNNVCGRWRVN